MNSYDLLAVRPTTEATFEQLCTKGDCDIISVDCGVKMSFYLQKTWIKLAQARGVMFEVPYASSCFESALSRKQFLINALQLAKLTKGKGLVFGSETSSQLLQRSPLDCQVLA